MLTRAQSTYQYHFWFDNDNRNVITTEADGKLKIDIEIDKLQEGLHSLHVQVTDTAGKSCSPRTCLFLKNHNSTNEIVRYWFDRDSTVSQTLQGTSIIANLDVSDLEDGVHMLHVQSTGDTPSIPQSTFFLKVPQATGMENMRLVTSIDGKIYRQEEIDINGDIIHYDFDATGLSEGVHLLSAQVITPSGAVSSVYSSYFLRAITVDEMLRMKCFYTIDKSQGFVQAGVLNNSTFHFDIDVAGLENGLHRIIYMMVGEDGISSNVRSTFFIKTPLGGNGIVAYEFWQNQDFDDRYQVKLERKMNPLNLMSLLPVQSVPLRTSQFHFEFNENGKPMIYAQNDFHIRFFEASGRFTDKCQSFTDYSVFQEVTDVELLVSGEPVIKDKPGENEIQWYHFPAAVGDSLSFKVDRACTVQVFAPSGKEVYNASGSDVVRWDGCHAWEDGEYYLALHDVTAQQGTNTKLEYQYIDKYDILAYDVHEVGNGGFSDIFFDGNGFYSLKSIELVNAQNDTIRSEFIDYLSDAKIRACFNFSGVATGMYKAVFHFLDEDRTINNAFTVEEAVDFILTSKISYSSTFLRGTETKYTINISNNGNMTAYKVPIYVYIETILSNSYPTIHITGVEKQSSVIENINLSDYTPEQKAALRNLVLSTGDNLLFMRTCAIKENTEDSVVINTGYFFTDISPRMSKQITISIETTNTVECFVSVPENWMALGESKTEFAKEAEKVARKNFREGFCCYHDRIECVLDLVNSGAEIAKYVGAGAAAQITECVSGFLSALSSGIATFACAEDAGNTQRNLYEQMMAVSKTISIAGLVQDCFSIKMGKFAEAWEGLQNLNKWSFGAFDHAESVMSCITSFFSLNSATL